MLIIGTMLPAIARASIIDVIKATIRGNVAEAETTAGAGNVQTMPVLKAAMNIDPAPDKGGAELTIVDDSALVPEEGPSGSVYKPKKSTVDTYIVRQGDTLSGIAEMFDVTPNTILWANDLSRGSSLRPGQTLTILPITGVKYTVKKGDTLASIAKKFDGDATEISIFNGIDDATLAVGAEVIIPNGEIAAPPAPKKQTGVGKLVRTVTNTISAGYYSAPLASYTRTQGIHGYNGVDLAGPIGTPILAAAAGDVIVAKGSGYNGGYGMYIVIQHDNGSQTLYSHASRVNVSVGDRVSKGQIIGAVGNSGRSTGPHLHFEIRNGVRNPF